LRAFLGQELAAFKVPMQIWFAAEPLPRLGTEKIDKVSLRTHFRELWAAKG
jgi:long-chain acyl-CoA synthetase